MESGKWRKNLVNPVHCRVYPSMYCSVEEWTLTKQNEKERSASVTTATEEARTETGASLEALTPQEEKLIRMLHGMSEDDSRTLQFGLGASVEAEMKLAMIERQLIDTMRAEGGDAGTEARRQSPAELLSAWLDEE